MQINHPSRDSVRFLYGCRFSRMSVFQWRYLGAGARPNMLEEWKRLQAGNMPILLDAFYCRDKRLSCLPLTSLPPSTARRPPPSPHPSPRNEENSRRNECHQRNLYFCTSHLLNGRLPTFPPPLPRERKFAPYIFRSASRFWHRPLFFHGAKEEEKRDKSGWWIKGGGSRREGNGYDPNSRRIERIVSCWSIDFFFFFHDRKRVFL